METRANHVLIGAFTVGFVALAMLFALWLGANRSDNDRKEYNVIFNEAVTGLSKGGLVQYAGITVGEVRKLFLDPKDPRHVIARIRVDNATPVKTDTSAKLAFAGLTGVAFIQLTAGKPKSPPLLPEPGQDYAEIIADTSALQTLLASSEGIVTSVNDMLIRLSRLLNERNLAKIEATIDHIEQVTSVVSDNRESIRTTLANVGEATLALKQTLAETEQMVARLERASATMEGLLDNEARALLVSARTSIDSAKRLTDSAYGVVEENRQAVRTFSNQGLAQLGPTLVELRNTLRKLSELSEQIRDNPKEFILGQDQPKEYPAK
ncbi:MAG: MlaD family protein [Lysobacterales bacterium]